MTQSSQSQPEISIIMGSDSDYKTMQEAATILEQFQCAYEIKIVSAHRTPELLFNFAKGAADRGIKVIIAGAGGAAHLPGMVAALTELPVIGVPVPIGPLQGQDSLLSIVQMPKGVPVATVAIGNAWNAGILAAQIISTGERAQDLELRKKIRRYKDELNEMVLAKKLPPQTPMS